MGSNVRNLQPAPRGEHGKGPRAAEAGVMNSDAAGLGTVVSPAPVCTASPPSAEHPSLLGASQYFYFLV